MKRRLLKLCVFLLLGAIVNVAVAWAHAIAAPMFFIMDFSGMYEPSVGPAWNQAIIQQSGAMLVFGEVTDGMKRMGHPPCATQPAWSLTTRPPTAVEAAMRFNIEERAYGWPTLSLLTRTSGSASRVGHSITGGIRIPWPSKYPLNTGHRALPLLMIWPGFAINTLFYAMILWGLFALGGTPFAIRHRRRIKHGLCPACAYPVGTSDKCTECGKQVKPNG